jgi:hypothetical protein
MNRHRQFWSASGATAVLTAPVPDAVAIACSL